MLLRRYQAGAPTEISRIQVSEFLAHPKKKGDTHLIPIAKLVRVSTTMVEQQESPEHQLTYIEQEVKREPTWIDTGRVYAAELTGAIILNRPEIQQMLADAKAGLIKAVVMKSISRLGRDALGLLQVKRLLDEAKVELIALQDGYRSFRDPELIFLVYAERAQAGRLEISKSTRAGHRAIVSKGGWLGGLPFWLKRKGRHGVEPHPAGWAIARQIFDMYLSGMGILRIVDHLNKHGLPTSRRLADEDALPKLEPKAQEDSRYLRQLERVHLRLSQPSYWSPNGVRTCLKHPGATGQAPYGRVSRKRRGDGKLGYIFNGDETWLWVAVPALATEDEFRRVQDLLVANNRLPRRSWNSQWLLSGLVRCGKCGCACQAYCYRGKRASGKVVYYSYYYCIGRLAQKICDQPGVQLEVLHKGVTEAMRAELQQRALAFQQAAESRTEAGVAERRKQMEAELADLQQAKFFRREERRKGRMTDEELDYELRLLGQRELVLRRHLADLSAADTKADRAAQQRELEAMFQTLASVETAADLPADTAKRLFAKAIERVVIEEWPSRWRVEWRLPNVLVQD